MNNINEIIETVANLQRLFGEAPKYVGNIPASDHPFKGKKVFVRCPGSGVFFCTLGDCSPELTVLEEAIRLWSWKGSLEVLSLASTGPTSAKVSHCATLTVTDAREIVLASDAACEVMDNLEPYEP